MAKEKQVKNVRVVATGQGFDGVCVRVAGDEFDVPESVFDDPKKQPSWFERVEKPAKTGPASGTDLA